MLDQGFVLDLVLLTKQPLHQSPIFSFEGVDPAVAGGEYALREMKFEGERMKYPLMADPLWAGTDDPANGRRAGEEDILVGAVLDIDDVFGQADRFAVQTGSVWKGAV